MDFNPKHHVRKQLLYCPVCGKDTEQGVWVQAIPQLNKTREFADCLKCDNTDSINQKQTQKGK